MQLLSGTGKLCGIEYFKLVFLKYINGPTLLIFAGLVTYMMVKQYSLLIIIVLLSCCFIKPSI